jgi:hypothetical protein
MENLDKIVKILTNLDNKIEILSQKIQLLEAIDFLNFISNKVNYDNKNIIITDELKNTYNDRLFLIKNMINNNK